MNAWLQVRFLAPWHIGTGRGGGPGIDARVRRTPAGLPILPGRTLKGVLRDAMEQAASLGWIPDDTTALFGTGLPAFKTHAPSQQAVDDQAASALEEARYRTTPGTLRIGSARLGRGDRASRWEEQAAREPGLRSPFFDELHQTSLDPDGVARAGLRTIEVAVPLDLWAPITAPQSAFAAIRGCLPLITGIGSGKRRGLGRVALTLHSEATP